MSVVYYHNIECSKSNTALELLEASNIPFTLRNYIAQPLSREELKTLLARLDMKAEEVIRKIEPIYTHFEGREMTEEEWLDALVAHPELLQRPIVEKGDKAIIARPPERIKEIL